MWWSSKGGSQNDQGYRLLGRQGLTDEAIVQDVEHGEGSSVSAIPDQDLSQEQFDKMKAQTMYGMVELLKGGDVRLMYISNKQAVQIAESPTSLRKMLEVLDVGEPKLVINLVDSRGLMNYAGLLGKSYIDAYNTTWLAGVKFGATPFLAPEDESTCCKRIDMFMSEVLIPLAAQTNAVVLANAVKRLCVLSTSFTRVYKAKRTTWGEKAPFTVISVSDQVPNFYRNSDLSAHWRKVRRTSAAWRKHDATLTKMMQKQKGEEDSQLDLDENATILLLNDRLHVQDEKFDVSPFQHLLNELTRSLSARLPAIALKTGCSDKAPFGDKGSSTLEIAADVAQSGTPTVFLDVRTRPKIEADGRTDLIQKSKEKFEEWCEELLKLGTLENLDVCSIAYFHDVLFGDGDAGTTETAFGSNALSQAAIPLHRAIQETYKTERSDKVDGWQHATTEQVLETCQWLANLYFRNSFTSLTPELQSKHGSFQTLHGDQIDTMVLIMQTLFQSGKLYHANVCDLEGTQSLVNHLVRLDRVPQCNPLEGLLLLRSAWCDYDVAMMMADYYKNKFKAVFVVQLLFSWLTVISCSLSMWISSNIEGSKVAEPTGNQTERLLMSFFVDEDPAEIVFRLSQLNFGLSAATTLLFAFDGLFNAKARWHQLRSSAGRLETIIWQYRARVAQFDPEITRLQGSGHSAESMLANELIRWRDDLMTANVKGTNFEQSHDPCIYHHFQESGEPDSKNADDFQSPVQPERYIRLRIKTTIDFYKRRIPQYTMAGYMWKAVVLLLGCVASILAHLSITPGVTGTTALATSLTSWTEFSDYFRKVERYSNAVKSLTNLLTWWNSLSAVEKASRDSITKLVHSSESIISEEQQAWYSSAPKDVEENKAKGKGTNAENQKKDE